MRRAFHLVLLLLVLFAASTARAEDDLDDLEDDQEDLYEENVYFGALDPLDFHPNSLGFSLRGAAAWWRLPVGPAVRWEVELIVHVPLDRFFGVAVAPPVRLQLGGLMPEKKSRRAGWGALAASLVVGGGVASAKEKQPILKIAAPAEPSVSASASTTTAPSTSASTSPPPVVSSPLSPSTLHALVGAAWKTAGLADDASLADLASRAKSSALAPELRLRAHRTNIVGARVFTTTTLDDHTTLADGNQTFFEARLTWQLDRLVFADEEVALERIKLERAELRERISARVVELAVAWVRFRRMADDPALLPEEREDAAMRALEAFLALDATTGGAASDLLRVGAGP